MSKTNTPPSLETQKSQGIMFVPSNCYAATNRNVSHLLYPFDGFDTKSEYDAMLKAAITNQIARVLEHNNLIQDKNILIPATLRLLGFTD